MLQYLNIILDDSSVSFCYYKPRTKSSLINLDTLKAGIRFAMMENLMVQFAYPNYPLPQNYIEVIETIDHFNIKQTADKADVCIVNDWNFSDIKGDIPVVVRSSKQALFNNYQSLADMLSSIKRVNIIITDIETFNNDDFKNYKEVLSFLEKELRKAYIEGKEPQLNLLTDRIFLSQMNNCGAGEMHITLAPNGKFYICPAFYYENDNEDIGNLAEGIAIRNKQLYKIDHAPICRHCDAYQCKRCIWLNKKTTLEINTPSHEQCVLAHLERNGSRELLLNIRKYGNILSEQEEINKIDYLDPFEKRNEWD